MTALLGVQNLSIAAGPKAPLVEDVSFAIGKGEALAVVGESGCGKSLTSLAIMGLLPSNLKRMTAGRILFQGEDLMTKPQRALQAIRGNRIGMIFQDPLTALNPVMTIGAQIAEVLQAHRPMDRAAARARAVELLDMVRIPHAAERLDDYPHQLSGGMRQRVVIAMAMACGPELIIADEPTTALDVTIQAQILDLLVELRARSDLSLMLITHDLGVVTRVAERMIVMYAGTVVESGTVAQIMQAPRHPYTAGLMAARPHGSFRLTGERLTDIPGTVPAPTKRPPGCLFEPRCPRAGDLCRTTRPDLTAEGGRAYRCHFPIG
ncbi:ABC transporter ATP-binding protein [Ruixingdingia sedimenti]|uniref:ABC transporter ATP-binding protein n=1 Tax=Ruixingdingia sedimenti TaxID=3073604 RepID=A0ABU1F6S2_9RHOB|nr:ABC transporter ATP-binding protein [Xinfangfangia sp. LG-4]MDR5652567.1 ABC transporter ATP-binding protein [Xinfangfangia sp. LG-4]